MALSPSMTTGSAIERTPPSWKPSCVVHGEPDSDATSVRRVRTSCRRGASIKRATPSAAAALSRGCGTAPSIARLRSIKPVSTLPCRNSSARHKLREKSDVAANSRDQRAVERVSQPVERRLAGRRMRDKLGNHRVIEGRHFAASFDAAIDTDIARQFQRHDCAGRRQEAVLGILGIDARFDGVAADADLGLGSAAAFRRRRRGIATRPDRGR